jgi:SAM-dependent methyltransferase
MGESFDPEQTAEFDKYAKDYESLHAKTLAQSGEGPAYFAIYKQRMLERLLGPGFARPVLDFGCGIGNLTCLLTESFPDVHGYDPSSESTRIAAERAPRARFLHDAAALPRVHYGAAVLANVLHHVRPELRPALMRTLFDVLAPGGRLIIFEHNPLNPLTRQVVAACPFDASAVLLYPWEAKRLLSESRFTGVGLDYIVFFPRLLRVLRPLEKRLGWLPLGAQVCAWGERDGLAP